MNDIKIDAHEHMNNARRALIEGNEHEALTELNKATTLYKKVYEHEPSLLAEYYGKLASILSLKLEKYKDSARYARASAEKYLEAGDAINAAYAYYTLGEIYDIDLDSLKGAADAFNKAAELYLEQDKNSLNAAECFDKLASIYYRAGEYDIVCGALKKCTTIKYNVNGNATSTALAMHNAGKMCFDMRMLDEANAYMTRALDIYVSLEGENGENSVSVREELKMVKAYKGYELI